MRKSEKTCKIQNVLEYQVQDTFVQKETSFK